ncbi:MAG: hypothetical protein R3284_10700, partial [Rubricoccaceae bacterium]|nr:hypothetical protein [Rubricoccaceae bacterium]
FLSGSPIGVGDDGTLIALFNAGDYVPPSHLPQIVVPAKVGIQKSYRPKSHFSLDPRSGSGMTDSRSTVQPR